jgi:hypothetical protein
MIGNLVFFAMHAVYEHRQSKRQWLSTLRGISNSQREFHIYIIIWSRLNLEPVVQTLNLKPVVQSPISANPGLNFNLLFLFMYFCMMICFKTLENRTSIKPEKISGIT